LELEFGTFTKKIANQVTVEIFAKIVCLKNQFLELNKISNLNRKFSIKKLILVGVTHVMDVYLMVRIAIIILVVVKKLLVYCVNYQV